MDATAVIRTKPARYVPFHPSKGTLRAQRRREALRSLVRYLANAMFDELLREADAERRGEAHRGHLMDGSAEEISGAAGAASRLRRAGNGDAKLRKRKAA